MTAARQRLGAQGEDQAAAWYEAAGYVVVVRNWRCRDGEIDLICRRDGIVAIVEVKTRSSAAYGHPAEAVTLTKQRRLRRLASQWLASAGRDGWIQLRFDVVAITAGRIEIIEAAF